MTCYTTPELWQSYCAHTRRVPRAWNQCKNRLTFPYIIFQTISIFCWLNNKISTNCIFLSCMWLEMSLGCFFWIYVGWHKNKDAWKMSLFQASLKHWQVTLLSNVIKLAHGECVEIHHVTLIQSFANGGRIKESYSVWILLPL